MLPQQRGICLFQVCFFLPSLPCLSYLTLLWFFLTHSLFLSPNTHMYVHINVLHQSNCNFFRCHSHKSPHFFFYAFADDNHSPEATLLLHLENTLHSRVGDQESDQHCNQNFQQHPCCQMYSVCSSYYICAVPPVVLEMHLRSSGSETDLRFEVFSSLTWLLNENWSIQYMLFPHSRPLKKEISWSFLGSPCQHPTF